jgi:hypothetical protein
VGQQGSQLDLACRPELPSVSFIGFRVVQRRDFHDRGSGCFKHPTVTSPVEAKAVEDLARHAKLGALCNYLARHSPIERRSTYSGESCIYLSQKRGQYKLDPTTGIVGTSVVDHGLPLLGVRHSSNCKSEEVKLTEVATAVCASRQSASPCISSQSSLDENVVRHITFTTLSLGLMNNEPRAIALRSSGCVQSRNTKVAL